MILVYKCSWWPVVQAVVDGKVLLSDNWRLQLHTLNFSPHQSSAAAAPSEGHKKSSDFYLAKGWSANKSAFITLEKLFEKSHHKSANQTTDLKKKL